MPSEPQGSGPDTDDPPGQQGADPEHEERDGDEGTGIHHGGYGLLHTVHLRPPILALTLPRSPRGEGTGTNT